jgi:hypothetical protein
MVKNFSRKTLINIGAALLVALLLVLGQQRISQFINGKNVHKVQVATLWTIFNALPTPPGDQWQGKPSAFDKESITAVTGHAYSRLAPSELVAYYSGHLTAASWTLSNEGGKDSTVRKVTFCRNRVSVTIDASKADGGSYYYIGLVWTRYKQSPAFCASQS